MTLIDDVRHLSSLERHIGALGNRTASAWAAQRLSALGLDVTTPSFDCLDWRAEGASLHVDGRPWAIEIGPYSPSVEAQAELVVAEHDDELETLDARGKVLLLRGELAREPLMPKNFPFYVPAEHQRRIAQLERAAPVAILAATAGVRPFPLIEDGDIDIAHGYLSAEHGEALAAHRGSRVTIALRAEAVEAIGYNVIARRGSPPRAIVTAHLDTARGTPGALDNAAGVATALALAAALDRDDVPAVEIALLNGEDHWAVPGQVAYMETYAASASQLAINLDGVGLRGAATSWTGFELGAWRERVERAMRRPGFEEGPPWYNSDHSMFVAAGVPALALTSLPYLTDPGAVPTHDERDRPELVDASILAQIVEALTELLVADAPGPR